MNELLPLINFFKTLPGAISVTEAIALYRTIQTCLDTKRKEREHFIDFGSYAGKSSLIAITALSCSYRSGMFIMIEPAYDPIGPYRMTGPSFAPDNYLDIIRKRVCSFSPPLIVPCLCGSTSERAVKEFLLGLEISYAFIDSGEHSEESIAIEVDYLKNTLLPGGLIVFHDFGNQYKAPAEAAAKLVASGKFEAIHIDWEPIFAFVDENELEEGNDSWHWTDHSHPNFIGAVRKL